MSNRRLIKKYRIDEVYLFDLGLGVGLYVDNHSGKFYAMVPEQEDGQYMAEDKLPLLRAKVEEAAKAYYTLDWRKVIRVNYKSSYSWSFDFSGSSSGRGHRWNPADWESASDQVGPMMLIRCEVATRPDGQMVEREWERRDGKHRRIKWTGERGRDKDIVDLPWDEETWEALHEFRSKIKRLDHAIRHFLTSDDFLPRLLAMSDGLVIPATAVLAIEGPTSNDEGE